MANIVTIPNQTPELISRFLDQFNQNQRAQQEQGFQQQQLEQTGTYQQGLLKDAQDKFNLLKQQYNDKRLESDAKQYVERFASYNDAIQSTQDQNQQAALRAQAKAEFDQLQQSRPELIPYVKIAALEPVLSPQRQTALNTGKFAQTQTGIAAGGGTDPNAVNFTTKIASSAYMPPEGFKQQQATDLGARDQSGATTPNLAQRTPAPSGNAVSDYEARSVSAMPLSAESLQSQTQLQQTAMQQAGEMARTKYQYGAAADTAGDRDIKKTVSGKQYADVSQYTGQTKNQLIRHYQDMKVPVLDRKDVDAVREVDNARLNQQKIAETFLSRLPKDPTGRIMGGAMGNKLSAFFQTDEYLAASGALRSAAIQALRATAGAKGLRLNQAEIALAVDNDIPKITDTVGTAMTKMKLIAGMLDSAENATLGTFGTQPTDLNPNQQGAPSPGEAWARKHLTAQPAQ